MNGWNECLCVLGYVCDSGTLIFEERTRAVVQGVGWYDTLADWVPICILDIYCPVFHERLMSFHDASSHPPNFQTPS